MRAIEGIVGWDLFMDVFDLDHSLVSDYERFARSFTQIRAPDIKQQIDAIYGSRLGQPFNSMRGAYYAHTRSLGGSPKRSSKRETAVDPIEAATIVLNNAIDAIDTEVDAAKARADEAKAEYEHLKGSAAERKTALKAKVDALST